MGQGTALEKWKGEIGTEEKKAIKIITHTDVKTVPLFPTNQKANNTTHKEVMNHRFVKRKPLSTEIKQHDPFCKCRVF